MNIATFIPARGGSKSIPNKNIKLLGNKPLIAYSIESAFKAGLDPIVSTDSNEIAKIAYELGAKVLKRPENLAQDKTSMFEVLKNEIPKIETKPDIILLLQPTSPFRNVLQIKTALSYFEENLDKYDSLISVEKVPEKYNPSQMIINEQGNKSMVLGKIKSWFKKPKIILSGIPLSQRITRRQDFPDAWVPTGSIYLFKTSNLKNGSIYGNQTMLLETESTPNINTQEDWDLAEKELQK